MSVGLRSVGPKLSSFGQVEAWEKEGIGQLAAVVQQADEREECAARWCGKRDCRMMGIVRARADGYLSWESGQWSRSVGIYEGKVAWKAWEVEAEDVNVGAT